MVYTDEQLQGWLNNPDDSPLQGAAADALDAAIAVRNFAQEAADAANAAATADDLAAARQARDRALAAAHSASDRWTEMLDTASSSSDEDNAVSDEDRAIDFYRGRAEQFSDAADESAIAARNTVERLEDTDGPNRDHEVPDTDGPNRDHEDDGRDQGVPDSHPVHGGVHGR